ncbi:uncharacterized protein BXZ73DRAFT_99068 [Epithele typhae]|uniref:uncharacterized protein n=1 Tax=Epithele typhae TaxID=378194 RepID=UPI0020078358|nr:uncharacterized protein BXZ73DRAFT_99068 [Epithele typhae]KAH9940068.1 hypothetical protein BXZ73DRAFT_99068 [Epithele typhae]
MSTWMGASALVISSLSALNVCIILGDRLHLVSLADNKHSNGERVARTQSGREAQAELVVSAPAGTWLLRDTFHQSAVVDGPDRGLARVRRTPQLAEPVPESELSTALSTLSDGLHLCRTLLATADDASGTSSQAEEALLLNAGHDSFLQGEVAARNVTRLIKQAECENRAGADVVSREGVELVVQDGETEEEDLELEGHTSSAPSSVDQGVPRSEQADLDADHPDEKIPGAAPRPVYTTKEVGL